MYYMDPAIGRFNLSSSRNESTIARLVPWHKRFDKDCGNKLQDALRLQHKELSFQQVLTEANVVAEEKSIGQKEKTKSH